MTTATFTLSDITSAYAKSENQAAVRGFFRSRALSVLQTASPDDVIAALAAGLLTDEDLSAAVETPASASAPAAKPAAKAKKPTKRERLGITGKGFEIAYDADVSAKCGDTPMIALYLDGRSLKTVSSRVVAGIVAAGPQGLAAMRDVLTAEGLYEADASGADAA